LDGRAQRAEFDVQVTIAELLVGDDAVGLRHDFDRTAVHQFPFGGAIFL
jgi:hypothetical protein